MPETTYTIHDGPNAPFQTTDSKRAETAARAGAKVTAVTAGHGLPYACGHCGAGYYGEAVAETCCGGLGLAIER